MFEQDYIMRLIHEIVRFLLKVVFHIDMDSPLMVQALEESKKSEFNSLIDLIDEGEINEAENRLYKLLDGKDMQALSTALLFYDYLNDKNDDFLTAHNYTRAEIKFGIEHATKCYGLSGLSNLLLSGYES